MADLIIRNCGIFAIPQLLISLVTVGLLISYLIAWRRRELHPGDTPWNSTLMPLVGISLSVGMCGTVGGLCVAFSGFQDGRDVTRLLSGLGTSFWTTLVGTTVALIGAGATYILSILNR